LKRPQLKKLDFLKTVSPFI